MRISAKDTSQTAYLNDDDAGESLAIFVSQELDASVRWKLDVYAKLDNGSELSVGQFYVSPPNAALPVDRLTRQVAAVVCPGAVSWSVVCQSPQSSPNEYATIELFSSKGYTAPAGVQRVAQRWGFISSTLNGNVAILAGMTVTSIRALGTGAGTIIIDGVTITVAVGTSIVIEPKAPIRPGNIAFANVNYTVEYLESA